MILLIRYNVNTKYFRQIFGDSLKVVTKAVLPNISFCVPLKKLIQVWNDKCK